MSHIHAVALLAALTTATVCDAMRPKVVASEELPGYPRVVIGDEAVLTVEPYDVAKDVRPVHIAVYKPVGPSGPVASGYRDYIWAQPETLVRVIRLVPPREHRMGGERANVFPNYEVTILECTNSGVCGIVSRRNLKTLPPG